MQGTPIQLPVRGVSDALPHIQQPGDLAGPLAMRNVRVNAFGKAEATMGPREGITAAFEAIGTGGRVQGMLNVSTASGTALRVGTSTNIGAGASKDGLGFRGQAFIIDTDNSLALAYGATEADCLTAGAYACSWHSDGTKACVGHIMNDSETGGPNSRITMFNTETGAAIWTAKVQGRPPGGPLDVPYATVYINAVRVYTTFTYVCAGPWVFVYRTSDGAYLKRYNINGWSWEVQDCRVRPDNTLAVLFLGTGVATGPVTAGSYTAGAYFRSAVALYRVNSDTTVDGTPLTLIQYGAKLSASDPNYEDHAHFRLSEKLNRTPRGMAPFGLAVDSTGRIAFGGTNTGFGPTDATPPDGTGGYSTVGVISAGSSTAALVWEGDTLSRRDNWLATGWYNDIPYNAGFGWISEARYDAPGVNSLAFDTDGNVYAAGYPNAAGNNVFKLRSSDGALMWQQTVGALVYQNGIAFDPVSGLLIVTGVANASYPDAGGQYAHVWKIDPSSGAIVDHFYLTKPVRVYGVDVHPTNGKILIVTDYATTP
ncbi:MAG: hypothetical protein EBR82_50690 [Caulobacteraceae bacterium]|nr:hypothetical protein [Caulobacteraceae bacterium]